MAKRKGKYVPGPGRPKGSGEYPRQFTVRLTDEQYAFLMAQEDAAALLRELLDAAMQRRPPHDPPQDAE